MRDGSSLFDDLIKSVYLAFSGLEDFNGFLGAMGRVFDSHLVGCIRTDKFELTTNMTFFKGLSEEDRENYNRNFVHKDILIANGAANMLKGQVVLSSDIIEEAELKKTEFFNEFLRPLDGMYSGGLILDETSDAFFTLAFSRSRAAGDFSSKERRMLAMLREHAIPAMRIQSHLNALRSFGEISAQALERLDMGVCTLGSGLKVLGTNSAASAILENGDFLATRAGHLTTGKTADPKLTGLLQNMSSGAIKSSRQLRLTGLSRNTHYLINVFPVLDAEEFWWLDAKQTRYVVFIITRFNPAGLNLDFLRNEFQLTQRELDVLGQLIMGRSLTSAARHLKMSHETARTHMKHIFQKMDVHSQAQLALKVLRFASVI